MPNSGSAPQGTPFSRQDAALRLTQDDATATCGHRSPLTPDGNPCQRPAGHNPAGGHRDGAGSAVQHVWQDHSRG